MDKKYEKIFIAIIITIIIIILLIILLLKLNILSNKNKQNNISIGDPGEQIDYSSNEISLVDEKMEYYTVRNCINNYLNYLNTQSSAYYIGDEIDEKLQKTYIYNILSKDYINKNNINQNNVFKYVDTVNEYMIFVPLKMRVLEKENVNKYVAYGVVQTLDNKYVQDMYIFVNLDLKNETFSIEPIYEKIDEIDNIQVINNDEIIQNNGYNSYVEQKVTNQYVTNEYFLLCKRLALVKPEYLYDMLDTEYREERFKNLNNFLEYINDNKDEISNINLNQYLVNNYEKYVEYVAKDQFENLYIFNEDEEKTIKIKFDTYTIPTDNFKKTYNTATDEKKVQMNIDKFIQMINRHDYRTSYNCIADSFKNNYFKTQEEFQNFIKNNFYKYNKFEFKSCEKKAADIYVCKVQLTDYMNENSEIKEINVIMQLGDNLDFKMSFGT